MRLNEFSTGYRKENDVEYLFAWAQYKRGDVPTQGEREYIERRVFAKFPTAELVSQKRRFVPTAECVKPNRVTWEFEWVVFK